MTRLALAVLLALGTSQERTSVTFTLTPEETIAITAFLEARPGPVRTSQPMTPLDWVEAQTRTAIDGVVRQHRLLQARDRSDAVRQLADRVERCVAAEKILGASIAGCES